MNRVDFFFSRRLCSFAELNAYEMECLECEQMIVGVHIMAQVQCVYGLHERISINQITDRPESEQKSHPLTFCLFRSGVFFARPASWLEGKSKLQTVSKFFLPYYRMLEPEIAVFWL